MTSRAKSLEETADGGAEVGHRPAVAEQGLKFVHGRLRAALYPLLTLTGFPGRRRVFAFKTTRPYSYDNHAPRNDVAFTFAVILPD